MWLNKNEHSVLVSPQGGSILLWQYKEHVILGPARVVRVGDSLKRRGETHWCYPNFGEPPEHLGHVGRHGWLRNNVMRVVPAEDDKGNLAKFETESSFDDNIIKAEVEACRNGVRVKLEVGPVRNSRPILPAFHPYFAVPPHSDYIISVGGHKFGAAELGGEAVICPCEGLIIRVHLSGIGEVRINPTSNCTHVVLWSDHPSQYFCVEPVFGKPGSFAVADGQVIEHGDKFRGEIGFEFTPED